MSHHLAELVGIIAEMARLELHGSLEINTKVVKLSVVVDGASWSTVVHRGPKFDQGLQVALVSLRTLLLQSGYHL